MKSRKSREFALDIDRSTLLEPRNPAMQSILAVLLLLVLATVSPAAAGETVPASGESLGGRLLDDLAPERVQPIAPAPSKQDPRTTRAIEDSLKASAPFHSFGASTNSAVQSLARVRSSMEQAQSLLAGSDAADKADAAKLAAPVQKQVISDLDKLIAELSKQCQSCNGQCQGGQCDQPKPGQNPETGKLGSASGSGRTAARDSTDRLDKSTAKPVDKGEVNEMVKALWGNLPERDRQQMLQSFSDEFLPKYELEIEQYYRRLSEEQGENQAK
jgi:hypothetical protein